MDYNLDNARGQRNRRAAMPPVGTGLGGGLRRVATRFIDTFRGPAAAPSSSNRAVCPILMQHLDNCLQNHPFHYSVACRSPRHSRPCAAARRLLSTSRAQTTRILASSYGPPRHQILQRPQPAHVLMHSLQLARAELARRRVPGRCNTLRSTSHHSKATMLIPGLHPHQRCPCRA